MLADLQEARAREEAIVQALEERKRLRTEGKKSPKEAEERGGLPKINLA